MKMEKDYNSDDPNYFPIKELLEPRHTQSLIRIKNPIEYLTRKTHRHWSKKKGKYRHQYHKLSVRAEITSLKSSQMEANKKLDVLIDGMMNRLGGKAKFSVSGFHFQLPQSRDNSQAVVITSTQKMEDEHALNDNFSFKVKSDLTLTNITEFKDTKSAERETSNNTFKKLKYCQSPDKLITLKFFEDSENFSNGNLIGVNQAGKSQLSVMLEESSKREEYREEKEDTTPKSTNVCNNVHTDNNENDMKDDMSVSILSEKENESENKTKLREEHCINAKINPLIRKLNTTEVIITSENNESVSVQSVAHNAHSSQERFKKVRGFNFKNNINTRKFMKPLNHILPSKDKSTGSNNQTQEKEKTSSQQAVLTENNLTLVDLSKIDETKSRKLSTGNIGHHLHIKKFITKAETSRSIIREAEVQEIKQ